MPSVEWFTGVLSISAATTAMQGSKAERCIAVGGNITLYGVHHTKHLTRLLAMIFFVAAQMCNLKHLLTV